MRGSVLLFALGDAGGVGGARPQPRGAGPERTRGGGKGLQEQEILERGLEAVGPEDPASDTLYQMLGQHHADLRNRVRAAELSERALKLARTPLQEHAVLARLVSPQRARSDRVAGQSGNEARLTETTRFVISGRRHRAPMRCGLHAYQVIT